MNVIHLGSVDSTNNYLRYLVEQDPNLETYTIVTADSQTQGKGQRGNKWDSEPGMNLHFSMLLRPDLLAAPKARLFDINVISALAVREALNDRISRSRVFIKWPNDILVEDKKIAGILTENQFSGFALEYSIVGIGVNVNQTDFHDYPRPATSLAIESEGEVDLLQLSKDIAKGIRKRIDNLPASADDLRNKYHQHLYKLGDSEWYKSSDGEIFKGTIQYVEENGLLIIRDDATGKNRSFAFKQVQFMTGEN